jgi:SAM-dependent methyltransferase
MDQPWEHPDWYDLHDTTWTAGPEREPEHYRELMLALPPLDVADHLVDMGAGTGKLAAVIAAAYPRLGRVTLVEPNAPKLDRAVARLERALPDARIVGLVSGLGRGDELPRDGATIVTVGSVLMPMMELGGGTLGDGLAWMRKGLAELLATLRPSGWLYLLETLAAPWSRGSLEDPVRRLNFREFTAELAGAGFEDVECVYRFRDRIAMRGRRP